MTQDPASGSNDHDRITIKIYMRLLRRPEKHSKGVSRDVFRSWFLTEEQATVREVVELLIAHPDSPLDETADGQLFLRSPADTLSLVCSGN